MPRHLTPRAREQVRAAKATPELRFTSGSPDLQRALDAVEEFGLHPAAFDLDRYLASLEARP